MDGPLFVTSGVLLVGCGGGNSQQADDVEMPSDTTVVIGLDTDATAQAPDDEADEQEPVESVCIY